MPNLNIVTLFNRFSPKEQKLFLGLIILALLGLGWFWRSTYISQTMAVPAQGGHLIEGTIGQPLNLNPILPARADADFDVRALIHAGLLTTDHQGQIVPHLAKDLPLISEDVKEYTISLQPDLKWSDGHPITADDIIFTIRQIQNRDLNSHLRESFRFVRTEKIDKLTVQFNLREPNVTFVESLLVGLIPAHLENTSESLLIGAGPYQITGSVTSPEGRIESFEFEPNPNYYPHPPYIENLTLRFYNSRDELREAYEKNRIHAFGALYARNPLEPRRQAQIFRATMPQYQAVFFNLSRNQSILSELKARQALRLGTNYQAIINEVYNAQADIIGGPVVGDLAPIPAPEYNLSEAQNLLKSLGWENSDNGFREKDDQVLTLTITTNEAEINKNVAEAVALQWQENLGIKVELEFLSNTEFVQKAIGNRDYEALVFSESSGHDPDPFPFWHSSQATEQGLNFTAIRSNELDQVIINARTTQDVEKRQELYERFVEVVNQISPAVFIARPYYTYISDRRVKGIELEKLVMPHERFSQIHQWYIKTKRERKPNSDN